MMKNVKYMELYFMGLTNEGFLPIIKKTHFDF